MKKHLYYFASASLATLTIYWLATSAATLPPLVCLNSPVDLGMVQQGQAIGFNLDLKNQSNVQIEVLGAHTDCGCTMVRSGKAVVLPGDVHVLKGTFDAVRPGAILHTVDVVYRSAEAKEEKAIRIELIGRVQAETTGRPMWPFILLKFQS